MNEVLLFAVVFVAVIWAGIIGYRIGKGKAQ